MITLDYKLPAHEAQERSYKESIVTTVAEQTEFLLASIGARITAAAIGLADARPLKAWAHGEASPKESAVEDRLRILFRVTYAISAVYGAATAAAFLRSSSPGLADEAPLVMLRERSPGEVEGPLLATARAFLEG